MSRIAGTLSLKNTQPTQYNDSSIDMGSSRNSETFDGVVIPPDNFSDLTSKIERIETENQAFTLVDELCATEALTYFELGGILKLINNEEWFGDYNSFSDLCEKRFGMGAHKARQLICICDWINEANLIWDQVKDIAWTKMRLLQAGTDPSEAKTWIEKAKRLTVLELKIEIALLINASSSESVKNPASDKPKQYDGIVKLLRKLGRDEAIKALNEAFPDIVSSEITRR